MRRVDFVLVVLVALLILAAGLWVFSARAASFGKASFSPRTQVSIGIITSARESPNLANGIDFGSTSSLPATNLAAPDNTNGALGVSTLNITRDGNSTVNLRLCLTSNGQLFDSIGLGSIPVTNEKYSFASTSSPSGPPGTDAFNANLSNKQASPVLSVASDTVHYRFWLDIPTGPGVGTYNNSITFTVIQDGLGCP